jgi:hypothetical protein
VFSAPEVAQPASSQEKAKRTRIRPRLVKIRRVWAVINESRASSEKFTTETRKHGLSWPAGQGEHVKNSVNSVSPWFIDIWDGFLPKRRNDIRHRELGKRRKAISGQFQTGALAQQVAQFRSGNQPWGVDVMVDDMLVGQRGEITKMTTWLAEWR